MVVLATATQDLVVAIILIISGIFVNVHKKALALDSGSKDPFIPEQSEIKEYDLEIEELYNLYDNGNSCWPPTSTSASFILPLDYYNDIDRSNIPLGV